LAEYKQVTVLFADVVHSMDIAAAVGAERLREIMAELVSRAAAVVARYGGTVDKFTGDGIMAVFGAPVALEDHAFRACLAALGVQEEAKQLAVDAEGRDGITLQLRIGLNSGQVIAGEIGSGPFGYTAIGEHVGMAQRMESVAAPGGVMLSESTVRLVKDATVLGEPRMVHVKSVARAVCARPLMALEQQGPRIVRRDTTLVGRDWELAALTGLLDRSLTGHGCVAGVVGPPGIGKSRIVGEIAAIAASRGVRLFSTFCESHTGDIQFHVSTRLLRAALEIEHLSHAAARARVREKVPGAEAADLVLLDDALGIRDPAVDVPDIAPDARRRRLTALVNAAALARTTPGLYVIEDAHWIDQTSESLLADFFAVVPQTRAMVVITYRPEYHGALSRTPGAQTIALAPLDDSHTAALITELLGSHPSVAAVANQIVGRAAGNPFFAQEIARDLADRGILSGERGAYLCPAEATQIAVPATLQAAIASRIDRLDTAAKRTLSAAAIIGLRFDEELLGSLVDATALPELLEAELVDQVIFTRRAEYAFRHPLIREVAYESQLKSERAQLHRRVAAAIREQDPQSLDENAALIAEHLEAAGDLHEAFGWHMRAGGWSINRDVRAARLSWQRAQQVADRLPDDDAQRDAMRIAPRTLLCASAWRVGGSVADTGFDELYELATAAGDKRSLVMGMSGQTAALLQRARYREASLQGSELTTLIESVGDDDLTIALLYPAGAVKLEAGEVTEALRLARRIIDLAGGDPHRGDLIISSPLAAGLTVDAAARCCLGDPEWKHDLNQVIAMSREFDITSFAVSALYKYVGCVATGGSPSDAAALRETAEILEVAERSGDDYAVASAQLMRGLVLVQQHGAQRADGFELLRKAREAAVGQRITMGVIPIVDVEMAKERARTGDLDDAIDLLRRVVDDEFSTGEAMYLAAAVGALVESLLQRGADADVLEAKSAIARLAAVPVEPGFVLYEVELRRLRALLAKARGDERGYRDYARRYREMATSANFEGHIALAEAMP
jgi:adenylate cyclase